MTMDPHDPASSRRGLIPALRDRLFGERDVVAERFRDHERRERRSVQLAHMAAFSLVVLLSLGSLVALSADALRSVQDGWAQGRVDLPATISVGVSLLMVIAMDTAILHAARSIRRLASGRAGRAEAAIHVFVLIVCCSLEAATFVYMSWLYDRPDTAAAWTIIVARGLAAPLLGVYLSLARQMPVGPRDVLHHVESGAGAGLLRDVSALVNDPRAPLERNAQLYYVAAPMAPSECERMDGVLDVLREVQTTGGHSHQVFPDVANHAARSRNRRAVAHKRPTSMMSNQPSALHSSPSAEGGVFDDQYRDGDGEAGDVPRAHVRTAQQQSDSDGPIPARIDVQPRADTGMSQELRLDLSAMRKEIIRQILPEEPTISVRELKRRVERATGNSISESTTQSLLAIVRVEMGQTGGTEHPLRMMVRDAMGE